MCFWLWLEGCCVVWVGGSALVGLIVSRSVWCPHRAEHAVVIWVLHPSKVRVAVAVGVVEVEVHEMRRSVSGAASSGLTSCTFTEVELAAVVVGFEVKSRWRQSVHGDGDVDLAEAEV